ncbi:MAG: TonB-dependent siderophore receptor [Pseudomonadota bacterium]
MLSRKAIHWPALIAAAIVITPAAASAQATTSAAGRLAAPQSFDIAAGALAETLNRIAAQSGLVVSVDPDLVDGRRAPAVRGAFTPTDAMARALAGSGLDLIVTGSGAMSVRARPAASPAGATRPAASGGSLPMIEVSADYDGTTTEHSGSYTTRAVSIGKSEHALREIPQSISVVTRQQLDDQNVADLGDSMRYVTGMRSNPTGTGVVNIESRGFLIDNYLIDGLPIKGGQGMWGNTLIDMSLYDRAEVWRGPTGLLEGAGNPSGTINLVRKRAQSAFGFQAATTIGSWNQRRAEVDLTGALNAEGTLRGRIVGIYDDRDSFMNEVFLRKKTLYGTLEYDFTRNTTLSIGATEQRGDSLVFVGLPQFARGVNPDVPRSTYLGSRNGTKDDYAQRYFAELEHRMDNGGQFRLTASQYLRGTALNRFMTHSFVDPVTRNVTVRGTHQTSREDDRGLDGYVSMPFVLGGLQQEIIAGANYQTYRGGQVQGGVTTFRQNVDQPNLDLVLPDEDIGPNPRTRVRQYGTYAQARLKPWAPLTVLLGGRLAWWETTDPNAPANDQTVDARFVPNVGLIYDLDDHLSAYASYNRIFAPQTERYVDEAMLKPRTGAQFELGLKGEYLDGRVNAHVAVFRIDDVNRAISDPDNEDYSIAAGEVRSQGFEAEVSGRLSPRWDMTVGYAYTATENVSGTVDEQGRPFNSAFPRHNFSAWTKYRFGDGPLARVSVGGGVRAVSKNFTRYGDDIWTQRGYALAALQVGYEINRNVNATLTVNNLFDKTYFDRLAGHEYRQTYYGEPRSVVLAIRARF